LKILLDGNFSIQLYHQLSQAGHEAEHMIVLGRRGAPDSEIRRRLCEDDDLILLTQDTEFGDLAEDIRSKVIISRVPQALPIADRVQLWVSALEGFLARLPDGKLFYLLETGEIVAWDIADGP